MKAESKRLLSLLLIALLLLSLAPAALAAEEDDGALHIRTAEELVALAENCALDTWSKGLKVVLDNDLSLAGVEFSSIPIFNGSFDGRGHTVYDLKLTDAQSPCGFFLETGPDASILALNVSGAVAPRGDDSMVGGIVGRNRGLLTSCSFTGAVSGKSRVGGVVGKNEGSGVVTACTASGSVMGLSAVGGVVGYNAGTLALCAGSAYVNTESVDPSLRLDAIDTSSILNFFKSIRSDNAGVTSDIGGVAGVNVGFLERCSNAGPVGYLHLGCNVGGVVGRSSGYVNACTNSGEVYGRRDVGGIVGQAEPLIEIEEVQNLLAGLQYRVSALNEAINNAITDASQYSGALASQLAALPGFLTPVAEALWHIDPTDPGSIPNIRDLIVEALSSMSQTFHSISADMVGGSATMTGHMEDIGSGISALSGATVQALTLFSGDQEADILSDDSDSALGAAIILGKVEDCVNNGAVNGDSNVGGTAGSISVEDELDPEGNLDLSHNRLSVNRLSLRAVLKHCVSRGAVTAKRECAGGIAGRMDLGLVTNCASYGSVTIEDGAYAGGVCGLCYGNIRNTVAKCALSGGRYVGGVVGCGYSGRRDDDASSLVADCYSLVQIEGEPQFAGAVSGGSEGLFEHNYFVPAGYAGMDKLSVHGKAEPVSFETFAAVDGIPEECTRFTLRFVVDGKTVKELSFDYGDSFDRSVFPKLEKRDGAYAVWDRTELKDLRFDTTVTAEYRQQESVLRSALSREDGRAAVYVEGRFQSGDALTLELLDIPEDMIETLRGDWGQRAREQFDSVFREHAPDWSVCVNVEEMLRVTLPEDGLETHSLRYLPPDGRTENHRLYLSTPDGPVRLRPQVFGSYYLAEVPGTAATLTLVDTIQSWWVAAYIAAGVLAALLLALLLVKLIRWLKRREKKQRTPPEWLLKARVWCAGHKKRLLLWGALALAAVAAAVGILHFSSISAAVDAYRILSDFASQEAAIQTEIAVHSDARDIRLSDSVVRVRKNGRLIACTEQYGIPLYFCEGVVYLENGRAFEVTGTALDRAAVPELAGRLFRRGEIKKTRADGELRFEAALDAETANEALRLILPDLGAGLLRAEGMSLVMTARDGQLTKLSFSGGGESESGKCFTLDLSLLPGPVEQRPAIPQAVLDAIARGDRGSRRLLTEDLLVLLASWMKFDSSETVAAKLSLHADAGLLRLDTEYDYLRTRLQEKDVHRIGSRLFTLYFTEDAACTANGTELSLPQRQLADTAKLIPLAREICLNGDFACRSTGQRRIYTVTLDRETATELAEELIPELKTLKLDLNACELLITVADSELTRIELNCGGTVRVVSRDVDSSVNVTARFTEPPADPAIPEPVRRTLLG